MYDPYNPYTSDNRPENNNLNGTPSAPASEPPIPAEPVSAAPPHDSSYYTVTSSLQPYIPPAPSPAPAKPSKKGHRRGVLAGTVAACMVFSVGFGFGGGYLANRLNNTDTTDSSSGDKPVIYQSVSNNGSKGELSVADVAEAAANSVVEINVKSTGSYFGQGGSSSAGSGVIITADGYIVTNNHVVEGGSTYTVRTRDGQSYNATLVGTDPTSDLAVLKIEATGLTPAVFGDSDELVVGETAVAIGNPLGELGGSVTSGIISALSREITTSEGTTMNLLQTSAAINPGNSGGGLFNSSGELIGIVNAKSVGTEIEGIGFAIPINTAKSVIESLISNGYVSGRVDTGFTPIDLSDQATAYQYGVRQTGIYVLKVTTNTDGFRSGDLILSIDGAEINSLADYNNALKNHSVGDKLSVVVWRDGQQLSLTLTLRDANGSTDGSAV